MRRGRARVGCSGWQYKHWRGDFYPADLPQSSWFEHYASVVRHRRDQQQLLPPARARDVRRWAARAPARLRVRGQSQPLSDAHEEAEGSRRAARSLFQPCASLGTHLGPVLYQLPPGWKLDRERLEHFLQALPRGVRHVIEFRDPSWYATGRAARCWSATASRCACTICPGPATGRHRVGSVRLRAFPRRDRPVQRRLSGRAAARTGRTWLERTAQRWRGRVRLFQQRRRRPRAAERGDAAAGLLEGSGRMNQGQRSRWGWRPASRRLVGAASPRAPARHRLRAAASS